jgi:hypothetical protein
VQTSNGNALNFTWLVGQMRTRVIEWFDGLFPGRLIARMGYNEKTEWYLCLYLDILYKAARS